MSFYGNLASTAARLIAQYGQDVTLRRVTLGAYNPATSQQARTTQDLTFKAAVFEADGDNIGDRDLVQAGDKMALVEPAASPALEDKIIIGGTLYQVLSVKTTSPGGTPVAHKLHLRT